MQALVVEIVDEKVPQRPYTLREAICGYLVIPRANRRQQDRLFLSADPDCTRGAGDLLEVASKIACQVVVQSQPLHKRVEGSRWQLDGAAARRVHREHLGRFRHTAEAIA